jgi:hypothetical protein
LPWKSRQGIATSDLDQAAAADRNSAGLTTIAIEDSCWSRLRLRVRTHAPQQTAPFFDHQINGKLDLGFCERRPHHTWLRLSNRPGTVQHGRSVVRQRSAARSCQPAIRGRTTDANNASHDHRTFFPLHTAHRALTHSLQRGVIQLSRICRRPHDSRGSYSLPCVKEVNLLMC